MKSTAWPPLLTRSTSSAQHSERTRPAANWSTTPRQTTRPAFARDTSRPAQVGQTPVRTSPSPAGSLALHHRQGCIHHVVTNVFAVLVVNARHAVSKFRQVVHLIDLHARRFDFGNGAFFIFGGLRSLTLNGGAASVAHTLLLGLA